MPFVTALIGWLTNKVAIVSLFRPRVPRRILGWTWQGAVPRRQQDLAARAAELMAQEVLQKHMIRSEIKRIDIRPLVVMFAERLVYEHLGPRLRKLPLLGSYLADSTLNRIHREVLDALEKETPGLVSKLAAEAEARLDVRRIVEERIAGFDLDKLEDVVNAVAAREFRSIEIMGAVLGFIVGLAQIVILVLAGTVELGGGQ